MTAASTCMTKPLSPLSEKAQTSADESYDYAIQHGLFIHLLTEEHLEYHCSVAEQQYALIPYADKALDEQNLPPLTIPAVTTKDALIVHQRVASVLQSACQWLSDEALALCETKFVLGQHENEPKKPEGGPKKLKLDCPVVLSDFEEDCAELRRTVARFQDCKGERLNGLQESREIESQIFDIPRTNCYYSGMMGTKLGTAMTVSEQTIRWLTAFFNDHQWKGWKDVGDYAFQNPTEQDARVRRMSSPLPPILSIEEYLPEGDVWYVSEGSDLSSNLGEYAAAAVNAIPERDLVHIEDAEAALKTLLAEADGLTDAVGSPIGEIDNFDFERNSIEDDIPFYTTDLLQPETRTPTRKTVEEEDVIFEDFIADSVYGASPEGARLDIEELLDIQDEVPPPSSLQSTSDEFGFQTVTTELLLGFEEDDSARQAKLSVPDLHTTESPPDWEHVASDAQSLFQWMVYAHQKALWGDVCNGVEARLFDEELDKMSARAAELPEEQWIIGSDETLELSAWLGHSQNEEHIHACYHTFDADADTKKAPSESEEELLESWPFSSKQPQHMAKRRKLLVASQKPEPIATPTASKNEEISKDSERPPPKGLPNNENADEWGALLSRFQRRKNDGATQLSCDDQSHPTETLRITAPELLIGSRAFASAPAQSEKRGDDRQSTTVTAQTPEGEDDDMSEADLAIGASGTLPKVILSAAMPRVIRARILKMLPRLEFVEREYRLYEREQCNIDTEDEADIVTSPSSGIILTQMVSLRQMDSERRSIFQGHLAKVSHKYESLSVLVYRNSPATQDLSPSDAMAFAQLAGFTKTLACDIRVSYIGGGETAVARHAAKLISQCHETTTKESFDAYLVEEATEEERFLRQAGLNVYDAQIVLGLSRNDGADDACVRLVDRFIGMTAEERSSLFGDAIGSRRALASVGQLFTTNIS